VILLEVTMYTPISTTRRRSCANKPVSPESAIMADHGDHHGPDGWESIIGTDERELVDPRDIVDGGRYRCE
jgi:hypothetical protein